MMRSIRSLVGFEAYPTSRCFRLQRGPIARKIGKRLRMPLKKLHLETPVITYLCILHVSQLCSLRLREEQRLLLDCNKAKRLKRCFRDLSFLLEIMRVSRGCTS